MGLAPPYKTPCEAASASARSAWFQPGNPWDPWGLYTHTHIHIHIHTHHTHTHTHRQNSSSLLNLFELKNHGIALDSLSHAREREGRVKEYPGRRGVLHRICMWDTIRSLYGTYVVCGTPLDPYMGHTWDTHRSQSC